MTKQLIPILLFFGFFQSQSSFSQNNEIQKIITAMLGETPIEENLQEICDEYGGRVTGSEANKRAVEWGYKKFQEAGITVKKEAFTMPSIWLENISTAQVTGAIEFSPRIAAKSYSKTTSSEGLKAELLDIGTGQAADFGRLGDAVKGKLLLVESDLCFDVNGLFNEYTDAFNTEQLAAKNGAAGIVFMSSRPKKLLYRFVASAGVACDQIILVIGREDAKRCLRTLRNGKKLSMTVNINATTQKEVVCHNVIAEIKGSEKPEEVVLIGAHLDSWGMGTGANDNACNVSMMIDIARQLKASGIQPKRTIRFALWNGEEQGFFGSHGYMQTHATELDKHIMTLSIDIGSGPIIGFFTNGWEALAAACDDLLKPVDAFGPYLQLPNAIVGTDNFDFMLQGVPNLVGNHKPATYGINYHASSDTFDKVDLKSLKVNSAIVAALTLGFANLPAEKVNWKRQSRSEVQKTIEKTDIEFAMRMFNVWEAWVNKERGILD